jgi:nitrate reductase gamma subunit
MDVMHQVSKTLKIRIMNNFWFIGLPYAALLVFIIGTIVRYKVTPFKVSSLSTQFLEGKQLFWGSRPFHWGIIFLFFGHLIALLFPRAVLAWNGQPVRLMIIEAAAFAFGLFAFIGLTLLIIRRLNNKRLQVVTTKMDVAVYSVLVIQLITGLWVAYFYRWGSSWFASSLTPYLRSIFTLNPDVSIMAAMPLMVKIHFIVAFVVLGMVPFTRFMHFLVYPFSYIWRPYQLVIWNWDRKKIRLPENINTRNNSENT